MKNVMRIINLFGGVKPLLALKIESKGFMPLCIEHVGVGPRNLPLLSVAHYYVQNGDLMSDPAMTFEVAPDGKFYPVSYTLHGLGIYQECAFTDNAGRVLVRPALCRELSAFARLWDKNIKAQGFVDAANLAKTN